MKFPTYLKWPIWFLGSWCIAVGFQYVLVVDVSILFISYVLTNNFINAVINFGQYTQWVPFNYDIFNGLYFVMVNVSRHSQFFVSFILMLLVIFIYFLREKPSSRLSIGMYVFMGVFTVISLIIGHPSAWINGRTFAFLAQCAPFWAYVTSFLIEWDPDAFSKYDFWNMGGDYQSGVKLVLPVKNAKAFKLLTDSEASKEGRAGISISGSKSFPFERENQNILLVGSSGSGKTQIMFPIVDQVFKRGDKAIILDEKGTYLQSYAGQAGVELLAVWDKRSIDWQLSLDIKTPIDCKKFAEIVIPPGNQPALNTARDIFEAVIMYLHVKGDPWGWSDVWQTVSKDRNELTYLLHGYGDGHGVKALTGDPKSADAVYDTLITQMRKGAIRWYAKAWTNKGVSLKQWLHGASKLLIIGGTVQYDDLAKETANIATELMINEIVSLADGPNRRIWLFIDELATLKKLEVLLDKFTLGRPKGLCVVAGIKDIGEIERLYGGGVSETIAKTFSTMILLKCSGETSQWASKVLGKQEILTSQKSTDGSSWGGWFGYGTRKKAETKTIFSPSEIADFDNLIGVIRVSGWPLLWEKWSYQQIPQTYLLVEEADWLKRKDKPPQGPQPPTDPTRKTDWRLDL